MKSYKKMTSSHQSITKELYDAINDGIDINVVDIVEEGNMNAVTSNAVAKEFQKYVTKTGTVYITVKDFITSALLSGITVKVGNNSQVTDNDGKCTFSNLKYGNYAVKVNADGYDEFIDSITLESNTLSYDINLVPDEGKFGTVNIQVIDGETKGYISNAKAILDSETEYTDNMGKCSFTNLKYGCHILVVKHDNYEDVYKSINLQSSSLDLTIEMNGESPSKSNVSVKLTDSSSGLAIAGAEVTIGSNTQFSDANGNCTFEGISFGNYSVIAKCEGYDTYRSIWNINSEIFSFNIKLSKSSEVGTININVTDKDTGGFVSGAKVQISGQSGTTDSTGKCSFTNMSYGSYSLVVSHNDYATYSDIITLSSSELNYPVSLVPETKTGTINVSVSDDSTGNPISGASVEIDNQSRTTDSTGKCSFNNMKYGSYSLVISHNDYITYGDIINLNNSELNYSVKLIPETKTGTININVKDNSTSNPISGAKVQISGQSGTTDSTGKCSFTNMSYGSYSLVVSHNDYATYSDIITLSSSELNYPVSLVPETKTGTINVIVTDNETSSAVSGASVEIGSQSGTTDSTGKCSFNNMKYGSYSLVISHNDYITYGDIINLSSSELNYPVSLTPESKYGNVNIVVTDNSTSNPISGAIVQMNNQSSSTDSSGKCTFNNVKYGDYDVNISCKGYESFSGKVIVSTPETNYPVSLTPTTKTGTINVIVTDKDTGSFVSGAAVQVGSQSGTTDSTGKCSFTNMSYGSYSLVITQKGYATYSDIITLSSSELNYPVSLTPESKYGNVNIVVTDNSTSNPISGAIVQMNNQSSSTDSSGKCTFNNVKYGDYDISIICTNYESFTGKVIVSTPETNYPVSLTPTTKTGTINVIVTDKDTGSFVSGAAVQVGSQSGTTDSTGKCSFTNMSYGSYSLVITQKGYATYSDIITLSSSELNYPVSLTPETKYGNVNVTVTNSNTGSAVGGAIVQMNNQSSSTDNSGKCTFNNVKYGDYDISIICTNYESFTGKVIVSTPETNYPVSLTPTTKTGTINVSVNDESTGSAISGAVVKIGNQNKTTDSTGKCSFTNMAYGLYSVSITCKNYVSFNDNINLSNSVKDYPVKLTPEISSGDVNFSVTDVETGNPISKAKIYLGTYGQETGDDGTCIIKDVPFGDYNLSIEHDGYAKYTQIVTVSKDSLNFNIQLTKSSAKTGTINVTVTDKDTGNAISGAAIIIGTESGTTDSTGKYSFTNMPYGIYSVSISCKNYVTFSDNINLSSSVKDYPVGLTHVTQTGNVNVTVTDSSNSNPIEGAVVQINNQSNPTDSSGKCTFNNLTYGTYDVNISCTNYESFSGKVIVSESEINYPVGLTPETKTGTINVKVSNQVSGDAVSEAKVIINGSQSGTTDSSGKCSITNIAYGSYNLQITHDDYDNYQTLVTLNQSSITCDIPLLPIDKTGTINVTVVDSGTSIPLENASVKIDKGEPSYTDSKGKCTLTDISYGKHSLEATHDNYTVYYEDIDLETPSYDWNVSLEPIPDYGSVYVTVTDKDTGSAMEGVVLSLDESPGTTDKDGKYTFSPVTYGAHNIKAYYTGYDEFASIINVDAATIEYPISLSLTPTSGDVNFTVTDMETGSPLGNANIQLDTSYGNVTGSDGKCTIKDVPFNSYKLQIIRDNYDEYEELVTISKDSLDFNIKLVATGSTGTVNVTVKDSIYDTPIEGAAVSIDGDDKKTDSSGICTYEGLSYGIHDIIVSSNNYLSFSGKVIVSSSETEYGVKLVPIGETDIVQVIVKDKDTDEFIESAKVQIGNEVNTTDSKGYCRFMSIVLGDYDLIVNKTGYDKYSEPIHIDGTQGIYNVLLSKTSTTNTVNITALDKATNNPISSASVLFDNNSGATDSDGNCTFNDVTLGDHDLKITHGNYNPYTATISVTQTVTNHTAYLTQDTQLGTINVVVLDSNNNDTPIESAKVTINGNTQPTDSQGKTSFTNLVYNTYSITVTHDNYDTFKSYVTLDKEEVNDIVKLTQESKLASVTVGVLDDTTSFPIEGARIQIGSSVGIADSYGKYLFTNIKYGTYDVIVSHDTFNTLTKTITVNEPHIISAVLIKAFDKKSILTVTVQDETANDYIGDANVQLTDSSGKVIVSGKTGTDGKIIFTDVSYHSYQLGVDHDSYETHTEIFIIGNDKVNKLVSLAGIDKTGTINVNVTDKDTGSPLEGAKVIVGDASGDTDSSGKCTFEKMKYQDYNLVVTHDNYDRYTDTITLDSDLLNCDVGLTPAPQTSTVKITVLDKGTNNPINGASVKLGDKDSGTSDDKGECTFTNVSYGAYKLDVSCDGYNSHSGTLLVYGTSVTSTVTLEPETQMSTVNVSVTDEDNDPLADTTVIFDAYTKKTDSTGKCSFDILYGTYEITLRHDNYFTHNDHVTVDKKVVDCPYTLTPYSETGTINITVKEGGTTNPVIDAAVMLNEYDSFTDSEGKVSFVDLPYGTYNLVITREGFKNYESTIILEKESIDYPVLMYGIHDIDLYVQYTSLRPVRNSAIEIYNESKTLISSGKTDNTGHFEFTVDNLPVQTLTAKVHKTSTISEDVTFSSSETEVTISVEDTKVSNLTVIVKDLQQDKPLTGATVTLSNGMSGTTDSNGECVIENIDYGTYEIVTDCIGYNKDKFEFVLDELNETYKAYLETKNMCDYVVSVTGLELVPLKGAVLKLDDWMGVTDENGRYIFGNMSFGAHKLTITHDDYDTYTESVNLDISAMVKNVQLSQASKKTDIHFTIQDSYSGYRVSGATVHLFNTQRQDTTTATTDSNGTCSFNGYLRNSYEATVTHGAFRTQMVRIKGTEARYDITMNMVHNPSTVTLTVVDSETQNKIIGANVTLNDQTNITDSNGQCKFTSYSGRYNVDITNDDYYDYSNAIVVDGNNVNTTLKIIPLSTTTKTGSLKVSVYDDKTQLMLDNVVVHVGDYACVTNDEGIGYIKSIPYGNYTVKINHEDYDGLTSNLTISEEVASANYALKQENQKTNIHFTVQDNFSAYKINGAHVSLYNTQRKDTTSATTDGNGTCSFNGYLRNNYEATITHGAFETQMIPINATEKEYNITAQMKHNPVNVNVTAKNIETKEPIDNAKVTLDNRTFTTDENGKCTIDKVYSNYYQIIIEEEKYDDYVNTIKVDGQNTNVNAELTNIAGAKGNLQINVYNDRTSEPVPNAKVTIDTYTETTNESGICTFKELPLDEYSVKVVCDNYDYYVEDIVFDEPIMEHEIRLLQDKQTSNISFNVKDDFSGFNINGANVKIYDTIRKVTNNATTDNNGNCSFNGYLWGEYIYSITHGAFESVENVTIEVYEKTCQNNIKLKHNPTNVTIKARNSLTQQFVPGAMVIFNGTSQITDNNGQVNFSNLYSGVYDVKITCDDFQDYEGNIKVDGSPVTFIADLSNETGNVTISVTDNFTKLGIEGATVKLGTYYSGTTDKNGTCILRNVAYGTFQYTISKTDYDTVTGAFKMDLPEDSFEEVMDFSNCQLNCHIKDADTGKGVKQADIVATTDDSDSTRTTDVNGNALFDKLKHKSYSISIDCLYYNPYYETITLTDNKTEFTRNIQGKKCNLTVIAKNKNTGDNIANANVKVHNDDNEYSGITDNNGQCILNSIQCGSYNLVITHNNFDQYTDSFVLENTAKEYTANMTPTARPSLYITVKDATTKSPISGANVNTIGADAHTGTTSAEGICIFENMQYKEYVVRASKSGYYQSTQMITINQLVNNLTIELTPTPSICTLTITNNDGTPISEATVTLDNNKTAITNNQGICTFEDVGYGKHKIGIVKGKLKLKDRIDLDDTNNSMNNFNLNASNQQINIKAQITKP